MLLAADLGVSLLSAAAGVSLQRSLWSTYGRMQGTIDQARWFALALLAANLAAGAVVACLVVALTEELPRLSRVGAIRDDHLEGPAIVLGENRVECGGQRRLGVPGRHDHRDRRRDAITATPPTDCSPPETGTP